MKRWAILVTVVALFALSATVTFAQTTSGNGAGSDDFCEKHPEKCHNLPEVPLVLAYPVIGLAGYGVFRLSSSFRGRKR
jgi:hypothetical protein